MSRVELKNMTPAGNSTTPMMSTSAGAIHGSAWRRSRPPGRPRAAVPASGVRGRPVAAPARFEDSVVWLMGDSRTSPFRGSARVHLVLDLLQHIGRRLVLDL